MSTRKTKKTKAEQAAIFKDRLNGVLLAVVVGIMPLIVRVARRPMTPDLTWLFPVEQYADAFVFWKAVFISIPAVILLFYNVFDWLTNGEIPKPDIRRFIKRVPVVLSIAYLAFVIISAIASSYSYTAWFGTSSREEGALMWMVYFIVFVSAMLYVREPKYTKPILWGLAFSSIIMGAIGVSQLVDRDFFDTSFAHWLVSVGVYGIESMGTQFTIANGTLFNPNTFGKYAAMVAPVLLVSGLVYDGKRHTKALMLLGGALMLVGVFASSSLGGLIGIVTATGVLVVTYVCSFVYRKLKSEGGRSHVGRAGLMFGGVAVAVVLSLLFVPPLNHRVTTLFARLQQAAAAETTAQHRFAFEGDTIIAYRGDDTLFSMTVHTLDPAEANWMTVRDGTGQEVLPVESVPLMRWGPGHSVFHVQNFAAVIILRYEDAFRLQLDGQTEFFLAYYNGQVYGLRPNTAMFDKLNEPALDIGPDAKMNLSNPIPAWGFEDRETWGSSRGYIWSRSFPLMPRRTIIGSGPDTFINVFPQHDMAGLHLSFNNPYKVVDKAHNLFIQTWIGTGGISAILLFALFAHYLFTTFVGVITSKGEALFTYGLRLGLLAGISGFVMSSMATDSTIGSTGVFFVLLGMGYGLNYLLQKQRQAAN